VAERNGLLNRRTGYTVPRVRIPVSPQIDLIKFLGLESSQGCKLWYKKTTGCSVARLSRLVWDQEVASSNLAIPTFSPSKEILKGFFVVID
jgi:hypothetical protein